MTLSDTPPHPGSLPFRLSVAVQSGPMAPAVRAAALAAARDQLRPAIERLLGVTPEGARRTPVCWAVLVSPDGPDSGLAEDLARESDPAATVEWLDEAAAERADLVIRAVPESTDMDRGARVALSPDLPVITLEPFGVTPGRGLSRSAWQRLDAFNAAPVSRGELARALAGSWDQVLNSPEARALPLDAVEAVRTHLLPVWFRADLLAARCQAAYRRAGQAVWWLFPIAVAAVALGALYPAVGPAAFPAQAVLLLVMLVVVWRADRARSLERWVEHRFLAERLRVAAFMQAVGFASGGFEPWPHLGPASRGDWIARVMGEAVRRAVAAAGSSRATPDAARRFAARQWVGAQRTFHADRAAHHHRWSRRLERAGHLVFLSAILLAVAHTVAAIAGAHGTAWEHALLLLGLVLPGAGAALGGFRAHREYSRIARRSGAMAAALGGLEARLEDTPDHLLEPRLRQVEQVLLAEVQDWTALMRLATVQPVG